MSEKPRRILVTGAGGLLGSAVIALLKDTHELHAVVRREPAVRQAGVTYHMLDLATDWSANALPSCIDAVFHLALSRHHRDFPAHAEDIFSVDVASTARLLEYARAGGARHFVFASSGGVYGFGDAPFTESDPPPRRYCELSYYLTSKLCGEMLAMHYTPFMTVTALRFFFLYGRGQKRDMLLPRLADFVREGKPIRLAGKDGLAINPVHAEDAAQALAATLALCESGIINVAGPEVLSLRQVGGLLGEALGKAPVFDETGGEARGLTGDTAKMRALLHAPARRLRDHIGEVL